MLAMRASMVGNVAPVVQASFLTMTAETTPSWLDNSGTLGNRMMTDSTGYLTWAPSNMLLNSATLSTQTVTVTSGATNILSFYGTGSITYSGAASGTLSGTGASNGVSVVLTMATTSLTLTVSGSVTQAQLERVTYQTQPRPWIGTTSAAVFLPRYDFNAATTPPSPRGMLIEEARTNIALQSNGFNTVSYGLTGLAAFGSGSTANAAISPDGLTNAALLAAAASTSSHYISQNLTWTAAIHTVSFYVKRNAHQFVQITTWDGTTSRYANFDIVAGTAGSVSNATSSIVNVGNGWYRISLTTSTAQAAASGNVTLAFINASSASANLNYTTTGAESFFVYGCQIEAGAFATSYIPTTTGSVQRVADVVKLSGTALTTLRGASGAVYVETDGIRSVNGQGRFIATDGAGSQGILTYGSSTVVSSWNGTTSINATLGGSGTFTSPARVGASWSATGRSIVGNDGTVTNSVTNFVSFTTSHIGSASTVWFANGWYRSLALYNQRPPDATLKQKSAVGAAY